MRFDVIACDETIEVDAGSGVLAVPDRGVSSGEHRLVNKGCNSLSEQIEEF